MSWRSPQAAGPGTLGIVLGLAALFFAFFLTGAGHGWAAPFVYSLALPFAYPAVLVRSRAGARNWIVLDIAVVALAIAADVGLIRDAISYGAERSPHPDHTLPGIHKSVLPMFLIWLALWLFWQFVAVRTLWRHMRRVPLTTD